jgi:hypothetical protein
VLGIDLISFIQNQKNPVRSAFLAYPFSFSKLRKHFSLSCEPRPWEFHGSIYSAENFFESIENSPILSHTPK